MESIFTSHEALELVRLLLAIEEPGNEYLLKSALVTDYFGLTGNELDKLLHDESGWEDWLKEFRQYHFIWHKEGFFKMMRTIISVHEVRIRLLSFADGERRLTNLLHLTELLHQSALENNLDMAGLIKWYSNQLLGNDEQKTEHQIRLETDENTVRIITIHKSKGLQYPIVFCPFLWDMPLDKKENFTFHDEHYNLVLELGSEKKEVHKLLADREELAENLRLLYVALTRARNRCYVIWGNINLAENSGLAYLLHPVEEETIIDPSLQEESIWSKLKLLTTKDIYSTLQSLAEQSAGAIQVKALPFFTPAQTRFQPGEQKEQLIYRSFTSSIDSTFRLTSFSTLTHQSATAPDSTDSVSEDHDANIRHFFPAYSFLLRNKTNAVDKVAEEDSLFTFPGGTKTGTFIHAIMEKVDFQEQNDPVLYDLIDHELNFFGFENKWREVIFTMVKQLTTVVLDGKELSLAKISKGETSREMEFFFPLKPVDVKGLAKLFEQLIPVNHGPELEYFTRLPEKIKKLHFSPVKGFMRGFIDLIFVYRGKYYLLDWKSNLLGRSREDYSYDELRNVMIEDYYFLQSYLYALALHKYLAQRIEGYQYQKHFGGIYYIFVRGVSMDKNSVRTDTGSQSGIYFDLPPEKLISNLENYLLAEP
jgi:exodeoxyribonuclease V beta subunit